MSIISQLQQVNIITAGGQLNKKAALILDKHPNLKQSVYDATSFLDPIESVRARLYAIRSNVTTRPQCKSCGEPLFFNNSKNRFSSYCATIAGKSCASMDTNLTNQINNTKLELYGNIHVTKNADVVKKIRITNLQKYGTIAPAQNNDIKNKIKATKSVNDSEKRASIVRTQSNITKYGHTTYAGSLVSEEIRIKLDDKEWLTGELHNKTKILICQEVGCSMWLLRSYVRKHQLQFIICQSLTSTPELAIRQFIQDNYDGTVLYNDRKVIAPKELDIYLPELQLGIEFNGIYFHSELSGRERSYHINKTLAGIDVDVQVIQIWSSDWQNKRDVVLSRILNKLGATERIYGRLCTVEEVTTPQTEREFFISNHIQGYVPSSICLALKCNGIVVGMMSFIKSRFDRTIGYELLRYATLTNTTIVGGPSKLFKYFVTKYKPESVVSYCDMRWGTGGVYVQLGFKYVSWSPPNFFVFVRNGDTNKLQSRQVFQKHKLPTILTNFNPDITGWENLKNHGYDRIWDCGNKVFVWTQTI